MTGLIYIPLYRIRGVLTARLVTCRKPVQWVCVVLTAIVTVWGCSDPTYSKFLPPGFKRIQLGMAWSELTNARPGLVITRRGSDFFDAQERLTADAGSPVLKFFTTEGVSTTAEGYVTVEWRMVDAKLFSVKFVLKVPETSRTRGQADAQTALTQIWGKPVFLPGTIGRDRHGDFTDEPSSWEPNQVWHSKGVVAAVYIDTRGVVREVHIYRLEHLLNDFGFNKKLFQ